MESLYSRNRIYISPEQQEKIKNTRILLGGAGLASEIAECALRLGFEKITIIDGDRVELSNLNRQNYTREDIGKYKAEALALRLLSINPEADIKFHNEFITRDNIKNLVKDCDIAINALDFKNDIPIEFDNRCRKQRIYVLHPFNFGWGGMLMIVSPNGLNIENMMRNDDPKNFELEVAKYVDGYSQFWNIPENKWFHSIVMAYSKENSELPPPQLSVGAWITAGLTVNAMVEIVLEHKVKVCPKFYLSSLLSDNN
ncbi:MAG: ThiF family adenylyltransferase [Muribaculaceae bacterium]|nr:ThiF family adenylyltransferase [Muribaculaceae bacterium]